MSTNEVGQADPRQPLLQLLTAYNGSDPTEESSRLQIIDFVTANPKCFDNDFFYPGHITGSALVVDTSFTYTLLTHHPHFDKWLQFGGHSDSDPDVLKTAFREASEESGLKSLQFVRGHENIFDVDIHPIAQRGGKPEHYHYDIRILLTADKSEPFTLTHESKDIKWIRLDEVEKYNHQEDFLRLIKKAVLLRSHEL